MNRLKIFGLALILSTQAWGADAAEKYPSKPIRVLVPFSAGSQTDILARWIGEKITESSGQHVVVDNRPSAGARIN